MNIEHQLFLQTLQQNIILADLKNKSNNHVPCGPHRRIVALRGAHQSLM